ncbi:DUF3710 domain-containing protein [Actinoplanes sp. NPDC051633]|uniref:DUF3710 domain-containing protein n=1 Tax=Actinoplanes sp. NPDC051633 TaxID=3155670 RepID=UPI0034176ECA
MFSRKRPKHVRDEDAPQSAALAHSMTSDGAVKPEHGPWDVRWAPEAARLDLGSLQIPAIEGVEVRVQAGQDGNVEHVVLVSGAGAVEFAAFAAPRTEDIWDEVRSEMLQEMKAGGLSVREDHGPHGPELIAQLPDPQGQLVDVRYVGVDGPRWFIRATFQGPVAADASAAPALWECLEGLVVVRDDEPRPVREPLPMRLPKEMAEQAQQQEEQPEQ